MKLRSIIIPFLFLIILSSQVYAFTDFFGNPELEELNNVVVWDSCYKTEIPFCNWFNPLTWFNCFGGQQNITESNRCWNLTYNSANTRVEVFSDSTNINWTNGEMTKAILQAKPLSVDGIFVSWNMTELIYTGFYAPENNYDQEGNITYYGDSFQIPRGEAVNVYLRYRIIEDEDASTSGTWINVYQDSETVIHQKLNVTEGVTHEVRLTIDGNQVSDYNLTVYVNFEFDSPDKETEVRIYDFALFTFDDNDAFVGDSFTDAYLYNQCNVDSGVVIDLYQNTTTRHQASLINTTYGYQGFACGIFLLENTSYTRTISEYETTTGGAGGGCNADFMIAHDKIYYECVQYQSQILFLSQVQPHLLKVYAENGHIHDPSNAFIIRFENSGVYNFSEIVPYCYANYTYHECDYPIVASGDTFDIDRQGFGSSDDIPTFIETLCTPEYICTFGDLYFLNADCSQSEVADCGVWGCNNVGDNCAYPTLPNDPDVPITNFGSFCLDNYTYYDVDENGIEFGSCSYPEQCRQITEITVSCLTDQELDDYEATSSITGSLSSSIGGMFGVDTEQGKVILAICLTILIAYGISTQVEGEGGFLLFVGLMFIGFILFTYAGWLPSSVGIVIIIIMAMVIGI